jgi:hypothetical protein
VNLLGDGAKPWKAVLSSDGLSDVVTPIFCLRRGKSGKYAIRRGTVSIASHRGGCLQVSDQRKRILSSERKLEPASRVVPSGNCDRSGDLNTPERSEG